MNSDAIKAIAGMAYYYGVVSFGKIAEVLVNLFNENFGLEHINSLILIGEELGYDYVVDKDQIYHIDVEDVENICE